MFCMLCGLGGYGVISPMSMELQIYLTRLEEQQKEVLRIIASGGRISQLPPLPPIPSNLGDKSHYSQAAPKQRAVEPPVTKLQKVPFTAVGGGPLPGGILASQAAVPGPGAVVEKKGKQLLCWALIPAAPYSFFLGWCPFFDLHYKEESRVQHSLNQCR